MGLGSLFKQNCCCPSQGKKFTYIPRSAGTYLLLLCCSSVPRISDLEKSCPAQHIAVLLQRSVPTDGRCYRIHIYLLLFVYLLFYLGLGWVFTALCGFSLVLVHRLLIAVAPLVAEQGLCSSQAQKLSLTGSRVWVVVVTHRLSCPSARGIFLNWRSNPCFPALARGFLSTGPPGSPTGHIFN